MLHIRNRLTAAGLALSCIAEGISVPAFAETMIPISIVSFENVSTSLIIGETPAYTTYLTGDALLYASIVDEGWFCMTDENALSTKSTGYPIPDVPVGEAYCYAIALQADDGYYFSDDFSLYYENTLIDRSQYIIFIENEGEFLTIRCDFIPPVIPVSQDQQEISSVFINEATLSFRDGDTPCFTAQAGEPLRYEIFYERWCDDLHPERFITSNAQLNAEMGLTEENCLTLFQSGGQYHYDFCITAKNGFRFSDDVEVYLNGMPCQIYGHSSDMIPVNDAYYLVVPPSETIVTTTTTESFPTTTTLPFDTELLYGDMNQDERLSIADVVLFLRLVAEDDSIRFTETALRAADLNQDGVIDLKDAAVLLETISRQDVSIYIKPLPAESDTEDTLLSEEPTAEWQIPSKGNSAAFTMQPFEWLTVSADENALFYDGQLAISEPTDAQGERMMAFASECGGILLDGWQIEAGLSPDEHLPGNYVTEYDLSALQITEDDCFAFMAVRLDENGNAFEYAVEHSGDILRWESDQNSLIVLIGVPLLGGAMYYAKKQRIDPEIKERDCWTEREKAESLKQYNTNYCTVVYSDAEDAEVRDARRQRMKEIEDAARDAARKEAEIAIEDSWIPWTAGSWAYNRAVSRKAAELFALQLQSDSEYLEYIEIENGIPADVLLLASYFEKAQNYLRFHEECPYLGYKPSVIFSEGVQDEGSAVTPVWISSYIQIKRDHLGQITRVPKETSVDDIYEQLVSDTSADRMLITLTHEMYHLIQNKVFSSHNSAHLKFSELSAMCVEHRAGAYFSESGYIKSYSEVISQTYETYKLAFENHSCTTSESQSYVINQGYSLSLFWEYLSEHKKVQYSGWKMLKAYEAAGSLTNTFIKAFGLHMDSGENELNTYWKAFQQSISKEAITQARDLFGRTGDGNGYFPSLMKKLRIFENRPSMHSAIKNADYSCTLVGLKGAETGAWSAVLVRDQNFGELLPHTTFMLPDTIVGTESAKGLVLTTDQQVMYFRERQDGGNLGASGYTLHFIPAPQKPVVEIDSDIETIRINLQSAQSPEGAKGLTDQFLLCITLNGTEILTRAVPFSEWNTAILIPFAALQLDVNTQNDLRITVCEMIDAKDEYPECRTASSEAVEIQIGSADLPELDVNVTGSGTYGMVYVENLNGHFTLNDSGAFTLSIADAYYETESDNPFSDERLGTWDCSGFTVSGYFGETVNDPTDFTAMISECSTDLFVSHSDSGIIGDGAVTCTGTEMRSGSVHYQLDPQTNVVTLTITLDVEMECTKQDTTEIITDGAISLTFRFIMN